MRQKQRQNTQYIFFNDTATTEIYTLSLHDALPIWPFIFTTAIPPAACAAGLEALKLIGGEEGAKRRERLWQNCRYLEKGLSAIGFDMTVQSPIIPVVLGEPQRALDASKTLFAKKLLVPAIRPPTVPQGTSRLRISLASEHQIEHLDLLLEGLKIVK